MAPPEAHDPTSELGSLAGLLRMVAATSRRASALAPHTVIGGRYTIERFLGRGGMGTVYAVRDRDLDDVVALKLLHAELGADAGYQQRLRAEVRLARRVSHPNVCRVHDIGCDGPHLFVTMELVRGHSLRQLLRDRATTPPLLSSVIDLIVQIASALAAAHRAGVLHRDVKPDNVMVDDHRAVLTDFGVATLAHDRDQVVAGTPSYIAPEVLRGEPFDHRADVYSTAVLAYELVTGVTPFPSATLEQATARAKTSAAPPPVPESLGSPALRAALDRAFARALAFDPLLRTSSMEELATAIAHASRAAGTGATATSAHGALADATSTARTSRRSEVRVATALVYRSEALGVASGEDLERIVVDAGGTPIEVDALEIAALFGVPVALGDDAERAARAALALIAHRPGRVGLDTIRIALRPGAGALAGREAFASAAALAAAAGRGEIVTSAVTARQLAARYDLTGVEVGGASARRLVGARPEAVHGHAATARPRELAALLAVADDCFTHRHPRHGEVRAPAGYGKTQLRDALIARLRERRDIDWLVARAELSTGAGPLALLRAAHPEWYAAAETAGLADRAAAFLAARRWLEARSESRPVAVVFDDVQWADEVSRAFLDQLVTSLDELPILIVTFQRIVEAEPALPVTPGVDVLTLGPLDRATASELVGALAPGATRDAISDVVTRAGGHPFFLAELARVLAEGAASRRAPALPATIEAIVQARIDRLALPNRELVTAAAVIGPTFWRDALEVIDPAGRTDLDAQLSELQRLGLIAPAEADPGGGGAGERYRFVHALVRDVAYARLAPRERRASHAAVAGWLLRRFPALATLDHGPHDELALEIVAAFAHHLEEAGEPGRAAFAYRVTGSRFLAAAMYREATHALRRAATLLPAVDAALATELGDAVLHAETIAEAETWYERALAALAEGDGAGRALVWHKLGTAASRRADHERALQCFERGLALAAPDGTHLAPWAIRDPRTAALLFGSLGWVAGYLMDDNERGHRACQRAVELLEGTPYRRELAHALSRLGATFMRASRFRDQLACNRKNLEIAVEIGDLMMQLTARVNLGVVLGVIGDIEDAIAHTEIARELATRSGARAVSGLIESNLAGLYLERGRLDDAQRCLDEALVLSERAGRRTGLPETYGFAARLRAAHGDLEGAARWATQSLELADHAGGRLDQAIALRLLAQIRARAGEHATALAALEDASARITGIDTYEEARTAAARARVLRLVGDATAADAARGLAIAELSRLGAMRELEVVDALDEVR